MDASRRRLLGTIGAVAAVGVAGCGDPGSRRTSTPLFVTNETDRDLRVTLRIYELPASSGDNDEADTTEEATPATSDLEQILVERTTLGAEGGAFGLETGSVPNAPLRVRISTDEGPTDSYDWYRADAQASLDVRIRSRSVRFTEIA